jgi:hypothetical protein
MALIETALTRIDFIPWEAVLVLWAVYGALFLPFTWEGKPDPKRRLYARYVIMGAVLLILTPFAVGFPLGVSVLLIGPAVEVRFVPPAVSWSPLSRRFHHRKSVPGAALTLRRVRMLSDKAAGRLQRRFYRSRRNTRMRRQRSQLSARTSRSKDLSVRSSPQRGQLISAPGVANASRMLAASSWEKGTGVVGRGSFPQVRTSTLPTWRSRRVSDLTLNDDAVELTRARHVMHGIPEHATTADGIPEHATTAVPLPTARPLVIRNTLAHVTGFTHVDD